MAATPENRFVVDIEAFVEKAKGKLRAAVVEGVQDVLETIITRTPVDTGFLRNSYYAYLNDLVMTPDAAKAGEGGDKKQAPADKTGAAAMLSLQSVAATMEIGDKLWVRNSAAYAMRLEYGFTGTDSLGRVYDQAGRAWIRGALAEAPSIMLEAAQRVANGDHGGAMPGGGGARPDVGYVKL